MIFNDYYVYFHRRKDNNIVFYIGKGNTRTKRAYRKERTESWRNIVNEAGGYTVEIVHDNLSEEKALETEGNYLSNKNKEWCLVNKKTKESTKFIDYNKFNELLYYDETSKSCLRWKVNKGYKTKRGMEAGSQSNNYWMVEVDGVSYCCHRIVYLLCNKTLDETLVINHIDSNRSNNKIDNLSMISISENNRQSIVHTSNALRVTNTSGINGISERRTGKNLFAAFVEYYNIFGIKKTKTFSYKKYGKESAWKLAVDYRNSMIEKNKELRNETIN